MRSYINNNLSGVLRTSFCLALVFVVAAAGNNLCAGTMTIGNPVPLSDLVAGQGITVGDKSFTDFSYNSTGDMPAAGGVNVIPIQDDAGNYGIRFQGAFVDLPSSQGGSDALITYNVAVTDPNKWISDAHLAGNPALLGDIGSISVAETFLPLGQNGEYTMTIYDDESVPTPKLVDWVFFNPPVKMLSVQKDILAIAGKGTQTATMSFVDQTFSQVPEPASAILGAFTMLALCGLRSRK